MQASDIAARSGAVRPQPTSPIRTTSTRSSTASGHVRRHTPVPEYIRLIAQGRYAAAYMLNWESNVFPGILGRVCDRPCEPACRRGRVEEKPVAICRLKRVAADYKGEIDAFMPEIPAKKNGKRIALIGAGPASLTVARDLLPLGYHVRAVREGPHRRRADAHQHPLLPPAGHRARRGGRAHPRLRRRGPLRPRDQEPRRPCSARASMPSSSAPARPRARTSTSPAARKRPPTSTSASTGSPPSPSSTCTPSAAASSSSAAATRPWTAAAPRCASAAWT